MTLESDTLSEEAFALLARYVERVSGIQLPRRKKVMVQVRVAKRARRLGFASLAEYVRFVFHDAAGVAERVHLVDALTTNKTDFFREPGHFKYLTDTVLPALVDDDGDLGRTQPIISWCAACSTGEEPYTLAMLLKSQTPRYGPLQFLVHATDISSESIARARRAVYAEDLADPIPPRLRRAYLLRSRDQAQRLIRVSPEIRSHVRFGRANLLSDPLPVWREAHIVFCRNVLIYFDRDTQMRVLRRVLGSMRPGGYLFVGHSEGLIGLELPLERVAASVYRLKQ